MLAFDSGPSGRRLRGLRPLLFAAVMIGLAPCALSDVVFNNFGPNDSFDRLSGAAIFGANSTIGQSLDSATDFSPAGSDYTLDSIDFAGYWAGGPFAGKNALNVAVFDDAGGAPGGMLDTARRENLGFAGDPPVKFTFSGAVVLSAGAPYWVVAYADDGSDSWMGWNLNSIGDMGQFGQRYNAGEWLVGTGKRYAFRANGTPQ